MFGILPAIFGGTHLTHSPNLSASTGPSSFTGVTNFSLSPSGALRPTACTDCGHENNRVMINQDSPMDGWLPVSGSHDFQSPGQVAREESSNSHPIKAGSQINMEPLCAYRDDHPLWSGSHGTWSWHDGPTVPLLGSTKNHWGKLSRFIKHGVSNQACDILWLSNNGFFWLKP